MNAIATPATTPAPIGPIIIPTKKSIKYHDPTPYTRDIYEAVVSEHAVADDKHPWLDAPSHQMNVQTSSGDYWNVIGTLNWCDGDIADARNFNRGEFQQRLRAFVNTQTISLCTGYYHTTARLWVVLKPLFEQRKTDTQTRKRIVGHIALIGKDWFNRVCEDVSWAEPFFDPNATVNFEGEFMRYYGWNVSRGVSV
jgi:hypothetical protein